MDESLAMLALAIIALAITLSWYGLQVKHLDDETKRLNERINSLLRMLEKEGK